MKKLFIFMMFLLMGSICLGSAFAELSTDIEAYWTLDNTLTDATGNG
jgi:hypothetical protein